MSMPVGQTSTHRLQFTQAPSPSAATSAFFERGPREFRGWLWQDRACANTTDDPLACTRRTLVSLRIPVDGWRDAARVALAWPPDKLSSLRVQLQVLGSEPGAAPLFDSTGAGAPGPTTTERSNVLSLRYDAQLNWLLS